MDNKKNNRNGEFAYEDYDNYPAEDIYMDHKEYDKFNEYADRTSGSLYFGDSSADDYLESILNEYGTEKKHSRRKNGITPDPITVEEQINAPGETYTPEPEPEEEPEEDYEEYPEPEYEPEPEEKPAPEPLPMPEEKAPVIPEEPVLPAPPVRTDRDAGHTYESPVGDHITKLDIPKGVLEVIDLLKAHTYTCYLVGDCVNMLVLGERVMDFDIACNASMERIIAICEDRFKVREDLVERGELIIINGGMGISVAPYRSRTDGSGKPIYCKTIDEDLRRRTFTSETVAYNPDSGIYDQFGGLACITAEKTILRAIDEEKYEASEYEQAKLKKKPKDAPKKLVIEAIRENPECILIAMQKYARGEAEISPYTLRNINENPELIDMMLPSEISRYFRRILLGRRAGEAITAFREIVCRVFPVLRAQIDFEQKSRYHDTTLYEHTAKAVGYGFPDYPVRLALLLHDIGKPDCAADRGDYMTFYGHSERGVMLARDVFENYEADDDTISKVLFMIAHHDDHISPENVTDFIGAFGSGNTRLLLLMQSANVRAKSTDPVNERVSASLRQMADNIDAYAPPPPRPRGRR